MSGLRHRPGGAAERQRAIGAKGSEAGEGSQKGTSETVTERRKQRVGLGDDNALGAASEMNAHADRQA